MFKICKRRGDALLVVDEAPTFSDFDKAEAWARIFLEQNPDYLDAGLESLTVVRADHPGIIYGREGNA